MSTLRISHPTGIANGAIRLDGSKSISNRVLIIRALSQTSFPIHNLSTSDDTQTLERLLNEEANICDVGHAGTTFRFLTAYLAIKEGTQFLTGSSRMLERPIGPLVDALRDLGCQIDYKGVEGYPPLSIKPCDFSNIKDEVTIDAGISSQYITALILIAPMLPKGLRIKLKGEMVSESYLELTLNICNDFGISIQYNSDEIIIPKQNYVGREYTVEADWSASSYYYSVAALSKQAEIDLYGLFEKGLQGDAAITRIGNIVGVESKWETDHWRLTTETPFSKFNYNFINQPDIAQTFAIICAARMIDNDFSGLKTLRIKETDRIHALNEELKKIGSSFELLRVEDDEEHYKVSPGINFENGIPRFATYKDHRMAMCLAPLGIIHPIEIENAEVVSKSYPDFYKDLEKLGFEIEEVDS